MKNVIKTLGFVSVATFALISLPAHACTPNQTVEIDTSNGVELCINPDGIIATLSVQVVLLGGAGE